MTYSLPLAVLGTAMCLALTSQAQVTYSLGPRVGLNVTTIHYDHRSPTIARRQGMEAGLVGSINRGHFALQPALLYSQKGNKQEVAYTYSLNNEPPVAGVFQANDRLEYLTLPVSVAYCQRADGQGIQLFVGSYVSLLIGGEHAYSHTEQGVTTYGRYSIKPTSEQDAPNDRGTYAQQLDGGFQAGAGYRYRGLLFQAGYSLGLRSVAVTPYAWRGQQEAAPYYNRAFQASLSYLFNPADK